MLGEVALSAWMVSSCESGTHATGEQEPAVAFDTALAFIERESDTLRLTVEVAETADQRAYGLMEREMLPSDRGMLFRYSAAQDPAQGFWMFRTLIPLDIAFLDEEGRIVAIMGMEPCGSPNPQVCRLYSPGVPFSGALEVNRGYFERSGVEIGDRVLMVRPEQPVG